MSLVQIDEIFYVWGIMEGYLGSGKRMISRLGSIGLSVGLAALMGGIAMAQQVVQFNGGDPDGDPVQILSTDTMRFNYELGTFAAFGDARVIYEDVVVFADQVEATFVSTDNGGRTAQDFSALGEVYFATGTMEGLADRMDADLTQDRYVFTGDDTQILTEDGRIFSDKSVSIDQRSGLVNVVSQGGGAVLVQGGDTIQADSLRLTFDVSVGGGAMGALLELLADGGVTADVDGTQITADRLVSGGRDGDVELFGNVRVKEQSTVLVGDCMIYNTVSGNARLFPCPSEMGQQAAGRVTGSAVLTN